jgi:hypothetical protein
MKEHTEPEMFFARTSVSASSLPVTPMKNVFSETWGEQFALCSKEHRIAEFFLAPGPLQMLKNCFTMGGGISRQLYEISGKVIAKQCSQGNPLFFSACLPCRILCAAANLLHDLRLWKRRPLNDVALQKNGVDRVTETCLEKSAQCTFAAYVKLSGRPIVR